MADDLAKKTAECLLLDVVEMALAAEEQPLVVVQRAAECGDGFVRQIAAQAQPG